MVLYLSLLLICAFLFCGATSATTINVNNSTGIQNAINTANNGDTLNLSAGTYNEHDITINKNLTITGPTITGNNPPTAVINAQQQGRVFNIPTGVNITVKYLLIQNGNAAPDTSDPVGGGIYNKGTVTMTNCIVYNNIPGEDWYSAGIYNCGNMTMTDSKVYNNSAGQYGDGGGIYNIGTLEMTNCYIYGNTGRSGAGIYSDGFLTVLNSNIYNNIASYQGGGIYSYGTLTLTNSNIYNNTGNGIETRYLSTASLTNCNVFNNTKNGIKHSGYNNYYYCLSNLSINNCNIYNNAYSGIRNWQGDVSVTDCYVYNNTACGIYNEAGDMKVTDSNIYQNGGGFYNYDSGNNLLGYDKGRLTVERCNICNNTGDGIYNDGSGSGYVIVSFSRIIGNTGTDIYCGDNYVNAQNNWWGSNQNPSSRAYGNVNVPTWLILNITTDTSLIEVGGTSNIIADLTHDNTGNYYYPTSGHVPDGIPTLFTGTLGSVNPTYTNTINGSAVTVFTGLNPGVAKIIATVDGVNASTQINIIPTDIYVSTTGNDTTGDGSSDNPYQTILKGISMANTGMNVHIANGTYTGTKNTNITINKNLNILGQSSTSTITNAQNTCRIFIINSGCNVTIQNLTLENGNSTNYGGAIYNSGTLTVNNSIFTGNTAYSFGAAIYNLGNLNIIESSIYNNTAYCGGGIYNTGTLNITNSTFTNNTATINGGAIYNTGNMTLISSDLYLNKITSNAGGAIYNAGSANLIGSHLFYNTAVNGGAIINDEDATLILTSTTVYNNTVTNSGGAIYNNVGNVTIALSNIYDNSARNNNGGAIYNAGTLTINNSNLYKNSATNGGAIYTYYRPCTFTNSSAYQNTATNNGGAFYCHTNTANLTNSNLYQNTANNNGSAIYNVGTSNFDSVNVYNNTAINVGTIYNMGTLALRFCRITGNTANQSNDIYSNTGSVDAQYNWWGSNQDPSNKIYGSVTITPWLVLNITANPTTINTPGSSNITTNLLYDSNGGYHDPANGHVPNMIPVTFNTTLGTITSPVSTINGIGKTTLIRGMVNGVADVSATVDNQTVHTLVTINPDTTVPTVISTNPAQYAVNLPSNQVFTVTFSEAIQAANLNLVVLKTSTGTVITTTKTINGNVLIITPETPLSEAKYLLLLYAGCVKDLAGNPSAALSRTYGVGAQPYVTTTNPNNYAVNITKNTVITATFNEPIVAKYLTLIYLKTANGGIQVATTKSVSGNTLTITPTTPLAANTRYMLLIYTFAVTDLAGNSNVNKAISFTTGVT